MAAQRDVSSWLPTLLGPVDLQANGEPWPSRRKIWNFTGGVTVTDHPNDVDPMLSYTEIALGPGGASTEGPTLANAGTGTLNNVVSDASGTPAAAIRFSGVAPTVTGIASGADKRKLVLFATGGPLVLANENASSTATNRILTGTGSDMTVQNGGAVLLAYDPTSQRWRVIGGGGDPPFTIGTGSAPSTGLLARLAESVGAGAVFSPILTWVRDSLAGTADLITIRDLDSDNSEVVFSGATGGVSYGSFKGVIARLIGSLQVVINGSTDTGGGATSSSEGPGGAVVQGNWMLGAEPSMGSVPTTWNGAKCAGWIGTSNQAALPDHDPKAGTWVWGGSHGVGMTLPSDSVTDGNFERVYVGGSSSIQPPNYVQSLTAFGALGTSLAKAAIMNYGAVRHVFSWRTKLSASATFWIEVTTSASGAQPAMLRFDMIQTNSIVAFTFKATMCRIAAATKVATYTGEAAYYRNASAAPALVNGDAPVYSGHETTAGDGVTFAISTNEIQFIPTAADADPRRWFLEVHVHEVRGST